MFAQKKKLHPKHSKTAPKRPPSLPPFFPRSRRTAPRRRCHTLPCHHRFGLIDLTWVWSKVVVA